MREVAVVTTGFFDGVHLGHRQVILSLVSSARERGEEAVVFTFWPHPRTVLQQDARELRLLTSLEEKRRMLLALGVDRVEVLPFTREFAALRGSEYVSLLRDRYGVSHLVMGYDNRIGSDGCTSLGLKVPGVTIESLSGLCHLSTASLSSAPPKQVWAPPTYEAVGGHGLSDGKATPNYISSSQIRKALAEGRIVEANEMLGYYYGLSGVVVAGNRMGRTIGFPTANMRLYEPLKLLPGGGVYSVEVEVIGGKFKGMCNIGTRPTVGGSGWTVETNIFDFDEDIYGLPLDLKFIKRLRSEERFPSLEALKVQLEKDREAAKASFEDTL